MTTDMPSGDDPAVHLPLGDLRRLLDAAWSPRAAADTFVGYLDVVGLPLPSLYLEQAGRLRCQAQRGYWQVIDGIPSGSGVLGRTVATGRTIEIVDAGTETNFLAAAPDLLTEICVPIRYRGRVVGAVSVESTGPMGPGTRGLLTSATLVFEQRLDELGGPPPESAAQRMSRLAGGLGVLVHEPEVLAATLAAAIEVSGLSSAAVVQPTVDGAGAVLAGRGPLADALDRAAAANLGMLGDGVAAGSSVYTQRTEGSELLVHGHLRGYGIESLAIVPLRARGEELGVLVMASERAEALDVDVVPLLEVLALQAAASLLGARALRRSEDRARRDQMTGLGHNSAFYDDLRRYPVELGRDELFAVIVIDVDGLKRVNDVEGHAAGDLLVRRMGAALQSALRDADQLYRIGGDEFATFLVVSDVEEARAIGERIRAAARQTTVSTVSVGVAVAETADEREELVDRADAAMYVAKRGGGDAVSVAGQRRGSR